eukprot:scaffold118791_cov63-Phaeocystis_antarctica.AAC.4
MSNVRHIRAKMINEHHMFFRLPRAPALRRLRARGAGGDRPGPWRQSLQARDQPAATGHHAGGGRGGGVAIMQAVASRPEGQQA